MADLESLRASPTSLYAGRVPFRFTPLLSSASTVSNPLETPGNVRKSVIVVGGGLAGIAASLALAKQGIAVTLLESKRRLGGRAGSFVTIDAQGQEEVVDYCQHVGMGCCTNLRTLISWLGQDALWQEQTQLHFYGPTGDRRRLSALPILPAPLHLAGWLLKWPGLTWRDRLSIAQGILRIGRLRITDAHDDVSAQTWLEQNHQTPGAIRHFWSTIIVSALGEQTARVSLGAVCKVIQDGFLTDRRAFHLLVPTEPLDLLFNQTACRILKSHGVEVQLGTPVHSIAPSDASVAVQVAGGEKELVADAAILAVPWHQLSHITTPIIAAGNALCEANYNSLESSPITGIHTWWDRKWLETPHAAIVGRLCQWVFPKTQVISSGAVCDHEHYYQIVVSASRDFPQPSAPDIGARIQEDLALVFPGVRQARLVRYKVVTDPQAVFSVETGALKSRPHAQSNFPRIWLAGDWTRTGWPATMESAITSGFTAADGILKSWSTGARTACVTISRNPTGRNSA